MTKSGTHFIIKIMPSYIRDIFKFSRGFFENCDLYWFGKKNWLDLSEETKEALESFKKIIYDLEKTQKHHYMMKQNNDLSII